MLVSVWGRSVTGSNGGLLSSYHTSSTLGVVSQEWSNRGLLQFFLIGQNKNVGIFSSVICCRQKRSPSFAATIWGRVATDCMCNCCPTTTFSSWRGGRSVGTGRGGGGGVGHVFFCDGYFAQTSMCEDHDFLPPCYYTTRCIHACGNNMRV